MTFGPSGSNLDDILSVFSCPSLNDLNLLAVFILEPYTLLASIHVVISFKGRRGLEPGATFDRENGITLCPLQSVSKDLSHLGILILRFYSEFAGVC